MYLWKSLLFTYFSDREDHFYHTLKDTAAQLNREFTEITKKYSEKITELCKLEKATWQKLDDLENECERCTEQVNSRTEELVSQIS